jgi:hypothetical protein
VKRLLLLPLLMGAVTAPPEWREDKNAGVQATEQVQRDLAAKPTPAAGTAQVFVAPDDSVLYVTLIARKVTAERDAAAREIVDSFLGAPKRAQLTSKSVTVEESTSHVAGNQVEATLAYTNDGLHVLGRLILVGDADHLISVSGECFVNANAAPKTPDQCKQALASLDPEVAVDKRVAVALAPEGSAPTPPDKPGPSITDVPHTPMAPIAVGTTEPPRVVDRRPVYVGAAIVILAGVFWLLRRRREGTR